VAAEVPPVGASVHVLGVGNQPEHNRQRSLELRAQSSGRVLARHLKLDLVQMPDLELTIEQAAILWQLDLSECQTAFNQLVASGFLVALDGGLYRRSPKR
jgi:hypothetical protein